MENKIEKIETQTTYNIEFEGRGYTVVHLEDADMSGTWEITEEPIFEDDEFDTDIMYVHNLKVDDEIFDRIVEYVIDNI